MNQPTQPEDRLKPFQRIGVDFLVANKAALLADQMRLGKTVQSLCAINVLRPKKILIVCPATIKLAWVDEFKIWAKRPYDIQVVFGKTTKALNAARTS